MQHWVTYPLIAHPYDPAFVTAFQRGDIGAVLSGFDAYPCGHREAVGGDEA